MTLMTQTTLMMMMMTMMLELSRARNARPDMRPKPADYDSAWYEESDGQWYNQYDWYQDHTGEWAYDYRMEEYGYTQNEAGEWVEQVKDKSSDKKDTKSLEKTGSKDGFSQLFSSDKSKSEPSKSSLPPRPPDYHDFWYQDESGAWYNEYDDLGYQFQGDEEKEKEKVSSESLPADYDTRWYQDEFGVVRNEYDQLLAQEREEAFYSDDELSKQEEILRREEQEQSKPCKAVVQNESVIDPDKRQEPVKPETAPTKEKKKLPRPQNYEQGWYQDYDGNWLNELDKEDVEYEDSVPAVSTQDSKNVSFGQEPAKEDAREPRQLVSGRSAKERWLWAYNKILQVGGRALGSV